MTMQPAVITIGIAEIWDSSDSESPLADAGKEAVQEMAQAIGNTYMQPWPTLDTSLRTAVCNALQKGAEFYLRTTVAPKLGSFPLSVEVPLVRNGIRVVETDYRNPGKHVLEFHYITGELTLIDTVGSTLVVALGDTLGSVRSGLPFDTFRLHMAPNVWIASARFINR